jgi:UDP-3-O-[3-hydroxymyristoyl] glucosamine N-acyltransferase
MTIHKTAIVSSKASIGKNVSIGQFTTIYDNVVIQDNTVVEGYCEIGVPNQLSNGKSLNIGKNSLIRSHSIFYEGSTFGDSLLTGHRVTVREKTIAGDNFQIGTLSDIQGHCIIGNYVRTHINVHIGQHSKVGDFVWIFPYVVLTNDPHPPSDVMQGVVVEDFAVIATMTVVLPGALISEGCLIGAHSSISGKTIKDSIYAGAPAKNVGPTSKLKLKDGSRKAAYPWRRHFHRGYPESLVESWCSEEY